MRSTGTSITLSAMVAVALAHATPALYLAAGVFVAMYCGIVLPAIWSTKPTRRRAATGVIDRILHAVRRPRSQ